MEKVKFENQEQAKQYVDLMQPYGEYYTIEDIIELAEYYDIAKDTEKYDFNDLYVAINMVENDYGDIIVEEEDKVALAEAFLNDIDAPAGKMKIYLDAMYSASSNKETVIDNEGGV